MCGGYRLQATQATRSPSSASSQRRIIAAPVSLSLAQAAAVNRPADRRISTNATSRRQHDSVRRAPEPIRSGRGNAGLGRGGAGTLPRVAEGDVREDLPDDRGIVQRGHQP